MRSTPPSHRCRAGVEDAVVGTSGSRQEHALALLDRPHSGAVREATSSSSDGRQNASAAAARRRRRLRRPRSGSAVRSRSRGARPRLRTASHRSDAAAAPGGGDVARRGIVAPPDRDPSSTPLGRRATAVHRRQRRGRRRSCRRAHVAARSAGRRRRRCAHAVNADLGTTVFLAEHRLERCRSLADRAVIVAGGASPPRVLQVSCSPTIRRTKRDPARTSARLGSSPAHRCATRWAARSPVDLPDSRSSCGEPAAKFCSLCAARRARCAPCCASSISIVQPAATSSLAGRNGSGKTTLLKVIPGCSIRGRHGQTSPTTRAAYVPLQNPNSLLFEPTVPRDRTGTQGARKRFDHGDVDRWLDARTCTPSRPPSTEPVRARRTSAHRDAGGGGRWRPGSSSSTSRAGMDASSRLTRRQSAPRAESGGRWSSHARRRARFALRALRAVVLGDGDRRRGQRPSCWRDRCSRSKVLPPPFHLPSKKSNA